MAEAAITTFIDLRLRDLATQEFKKVEAAATRAGTSGYQAFRGFTREIRSGVRELRGFFGVFGLAQIAHRYIVPLVEGWIKVAEETAKAREQLALYLTLRGAGSEFDAGVKQTIDDLVKLGELTRKEATQIALFGDASNVTAHEVLNLGTLARFMADNLGGDKVKAAQVLIQGAAGNFEDLGKALGYSVTNAADFQKVINGLISREAQGEIEKTAAAIRDLTSSQQFQVSGTARGLDDLRERLKFLREFQSAAADRAASLAPLDPNAAAMEKREAAAREKLKKDLEEKKKLDADIAAGEREYHTERMHQLQEEARFREQMQEQLRRGIGSDHAQFALAIEDARELAIETYSVYSATKAATAAASTFADGLGTALGTLAVDSKAGSKAFKAFVREMIIEIVKLIAWFTALAIAKALAGESADTKKINELASFGNAGNWKPAGGYKKYGGVVSGDMRGAYGLPQRNFAMGGVADHPMMAVFGEGHQKEAFIPIPSGGRIPAIVKDSGGGIVNNYYITATDADSFRREMAKNGDLMAGANVRAQSTSPAYRRGMGTSGKLL